MSVNMVFMVFLYLLIWNNLDNMHITLRPFPFLSFQAKKSKQAANTANVKRQLQSLRNNLKLWDLEERHPTFENPGDILESPGKLCGICCHISTGCRISSMNRMIEKPHEFTEGTFFQLHEHFFWGKERTSEVRGTIGLSSLTTPQMIRERHLSE